MVIKMEDQHVLEFSCNAELFALIDEQGILRIWDTKTNELKQEYTPNLHLDGACSAFTWIEVAPKKSKRSSGLQNDVQHSLYIALCSAAGQVSLYSYALGKVERTLTGEGHAARITCCVYDKCGKLYTCAGDGQIIVWDIAEGKRFKSWNIENEKPYSLAYLPLSKSLVVGCREILVYSLATQELIQTFTGHTSDVNIMSSFVTDEGIEYAVSTSKMERIVSIWEMNAEEHGNLAKATLIIDDHVQSINCNMNNDDGQLRIVAVTTKGAAHLYVLTLQDVKAGKPIKPNVTMKVASNDQNVTRALAIQAASIKHGHRANEILLSYGYRNFTVFESVEPQMEKKLQVLVRDDPRKLYSSKSRKEDFALKKVTPLVDDAYVDKKSSLIATKRKDTPVETPMEVRLQNLNVNSENVTVQPHSKAQLLVQALHSRDESLLKTVLYTNDRKTIELTLHNLPPRYVALLTNELANLMQKNRTCVEYSTSWLKVLTQTHCSQLMALGADELLDKFGPCLGVIEQRVRCFNEMLKLSGRLKMLINQIKRNAERINANEKNALIYEDNDSSNSDDESRISMSEWEEDDDGVEDMMKDLLENKEESTESYERMQE